MLLIAVIFRLFQKQVVEHDAYVAMAKNQQVTSKENLAKRGSVLIHDDLESSGSTIEAALDIDKYEVSVVPKNLKDKKDTATKLSSILGIGYDEIFNKINNDKVYLPPLAQGLASEVADKINKEDITGVIVSPQFSRYYPENNLLSQVLGFVNADGKGTYGIENYYNSELTGYSGKTTAEKDTLGRMIDVLSTDPPKDGDTIVLTIDRSVQYFVEKALEKALTDYQADSGSIIIVEPKTGRIIAMANKPDFNPNEYSKITAENLGVFVNQAIAGAWEPGSIMKPITMAAAIEQGKVTPETTGDYGNYVTVDGHEIHTATDVAYGHETMTQVLENSDNVAMVDVSNKLGNQAEYDNLVKFGLLNKTGIDTSGETVGQVPKLKDWRNISRATISFGQGITVTPIQIIMAYAALANGGKLVEPHLVDKIISSTGEETNIQPKEVSQVISAETAAKIRDMLVSVVVNGHGKKAAVPGFSVAGKTGTAQIAKADGSGYEEELFNGSFAGFAPANDPKFAMIVRLNKPKTVKFAESSATPVFGQIANYLLNYYYKLPVTK